MFFSSCSFNQNEEVIEHRGVDARETREDEILTQVMGMTLEEKIGQLFIGGIDGNTSLTQNDISLIRDLKIGGLIFFGRNISTANQTINLINQIKTINNEIGNIPLFISLDQEGGLVTRLPKEINKFPKANQVGEINDENYAYNIGKLMGEIIYSLGFNMDFAPVLDVYTNPKNTVIGSRSFSSDKDIVAKLGVATMKGLKDSGIIAVGKHYPGHGDTYEDSHEELPVLSHNYERLMDVELYPFKAAIENGLDSILVSHLFYPQIDSENIATLSRIFLFEILRKELGFRGIVITDDMIMKGLTDTNSIPEASLKALKAGVDILLIGSGYENISSSIDRIKQAVLDGEIQEFEIDRKVYNILRIKKQYDINHEMIENVDAFEINNKINEILKKN